MEFALILRELWGKKGWLAVGVVVSMFLAVLSVDKVQLLPPKLVSRDLQYSSASVQAFVDTPDSFVGDVARDVTPGINRATVYANLMASPGAMDLVGRFAGIPGDQIWAAGPVDPTQQRVVVEPTVTKRSYQISGEALPYRIEFQANPNLPIISIYTQAPSTKQALALANSSVTALKYYIAEQQAAQHVPPAVRVVLRTIGPANGGVVNGGIGKKLAGIVFVAAFVGWCALMLIATRIRRNWRMSALLLQLGPIFRDGDRLARAAEADRPAHARRAPAPSGRANSSANGSTSRVPTNRK
jgi:hypothetical protein